MQIIRETKLKQITNWIEQEQDDEFNFKDITQSETLSEASSTSNISYLSKISSQSTRKKKQVFLILFN